MQHNNTAHSRPIKCRNCTSDSKALQSFAGFWLGFSQIAALEAASSARNKAKVRKLTCTGEVSPLPDCSKLID
jgi:hypothetical protein